MRKMQTEMSQLKNFVSKMKSSLKGFTSRVTAVED